MTYVYKKYFENNSCEIEETGGSMIENLMTGKCPQTPLCPPASRQVSGAKGHNQEEMSRARFQLATTFPGSPGLRPSGFTLQLFYKIPFSPEESDDPSAAYKMARPDNHKIGLLGPQQVFYFRCHPTIPFENQLFKNAR